MATTPGIDISKYQGIEIDSLTPEDSGLQFVICKATEGITYTDPQFSHNWSTIAAHGFIKGAYHFYRTNDAPQPQATNFINAITDLPKAAFPPIVDFEEGSIVGNNSTTQIVTDLLSFLTILEDKFNRIPMIYTDVNTGNKYLTDERFKRYPLWIANYTNAASPTLPGAWKGTDWLLWQRNDNYKVKTVTNDFDLFNGDLNALKQFIANH